MNTKMPPRARGAFTLIELLVVIAIIAVLIAMLLPALGKARTAGRQGVVLGRLHDMGVGFSAYLNDYKERLPALRDYDEKPVIALSLLAKVNAIPPVTFVNPNTTDTKATVIADDGRPVLASLQGVEIDEATTIEPGNIGGVEFHCSFSFDNDIKPHGVWMPVVYAGDRADYESGVTFSKNWGTARKPGTGGMCLLWTDQHASFRTSRALPDQSDPNMYHHNEFGGEGANELREGVQVAPGTLDTHLRFFSEEEDDALLPDPP